MKKLLALSLFVIMASACSLLAFEKNIPFQIDGLKWGDPAERLNSLEPLEETPSVDYGFTPYFNSSAPMGWNGVPLLDSTYYFKENKFMLYIATFSASELESLQKSAVNHWGEPTFVQGRRDKLTYVWGGGDFSVSATILATENTGSDDRVLLVIGPSAVFGDLQNAYRGNSQTTVTPRN